jgi:hypothetical protein
MSLFIQTDDANLKANVSYNSLEEWMAGEFEYLLTYHASFDLKKALLKLIKKGSNPFPVMYLGKGMHASVWLTARGTVWRIPSSIVDFGGDYLKDCYRTSVKKDWMPIVHSVVQCSDVLWVAEVERLYLVQESVVDPVFKKLYRDWNDLATGDEPFRDVPDVISQLEKLHTYSKLKDSRLTYSANFVLWLAFIRDSVELKEVLAEEVLFEGPFVKDFAWLLKCAERTEEAHNIPGIRLDVYGPNLMARAGTGQLVLTDPFFV